MSDSDASSFAKDAPTWEEMQSNVEENPFQIGTRQRKERTETNRAGLETDEIRERSKERSEREKLAGSVLGEKEPGIGAKEREQANINYRATGEVSAQPREGFRGKEASEGRATELEAEEHRMDLENIDPSKVVEAAQNEKLSEERPYDPEKEPEAEKPEEVEEFKVDDGRKAAWGRTLRDIGVAGLSVGADLLQAAEKQYGAVVKLTGQLMQGKPMSLPSQALTATMTGLSTMNEVAEDAAEDLGVKPGVDPEKLRDQLAIKGPAYYADKDRAKQNTQYIIQTFNDSVERAAKGKDLSQLTDEELVNVYNDMEKVLRPEYDRISQMPPERMSQADRAFYNSYIALNKGIGQRAKAIRQEQREQVRGMKQRQKEDKEFLNQNRSAWYRSGEMKEPKDINAYKRELEEKYRTGAPLTDEEEEDYDDIILNYGWRGSVETLGRDMARKPHRVPLWTQKAGRKLANNMGGRDEVLRMYDLARKWDIDALRAMIDTPEKRNAAMGFARMGLANQNNAVMREKFPMSTDDIMLGYAIESALSGKDIRPPMEIPQKFAKPKWISDEEALEAKKTAEKEAEIQRERQKKQSESPKTDGIPAEKPKKEAAAPKKKSNLPPGAVPYGPGRRPRVTYPRKYVEETPSEASETAEEAQEPVQEPVVPQNAKEQPQNEDIQRWETFDDTRTGRKSLKKQSADLKLRMNAAKGTPGFEDASNRFMQSKVEELLLDANSSETGYEEWYLDILNDIRNGLSRKAYAAGGLGNIASGPAQDVNRKLYGSLRPGREKAPETVPETVKDDKESNEGRAEKKLKNLYKDAENTISTANSLIDSWEREYKAANTPHKAELIRNELSKKIEEIRRRGTSILDDESDRGRSTRGTLADLQAQLEELYKKTLDPVIKETPKEEEPVKSTAVKKPVPANKGRTGSARKNKNEDAAKIAEDQRIAEKAKETIREGKEGDEVTLKEIYDRNREQLGNFASFLDPIRRYYKSLGKEMTDAERAEYKEVYDHFEDLTREAIGQQMDSSVKIEENPKRERKMLNVKDENGNPTKKWVAQFDPDDDRDADAVLSQKLKYKKG